jgi:hypothetical protein
VTGQVELRIVVHSKYMVTISSVIFDMPLTKKNIACHVIVQNLLKNIFFTAHSLHVIAHRQLISFYMTARQP